MSSSVDTHRIECLYCGDIWDTTMYSKQDIKDLRCRCGESKNFAIEKIETTDIFGYRFSPDFPKKSKEKQDFRDDFSDYYYMGQYTGMSD